MIINTLVQVPIPSTAAGLEKFDFSSNTDDGAFLFSFWYFNNQWNCWVTLPTGEIRTAGIFSNNINWTAFGDYSLLIVFSNSTITFDDIINLGVYIIKWI